MNLKAGALLCALILLVSAQAARAQDSGGQASSAPGTGAQAAGASAVGAQGTGTQGTPDHTPQPYAPGEFPGWLSDVWRAEAVFVGSFPLTLFATLEVYDSYRYFNSGLDPHYAPWPFGSGAAAAYDSNETLWLAVSALSLSLAVSGIDFLLGQLHDGSPGN